MNPVETYDASVASVRTLMDTFWSSRGWNSSPKWPAEPELRDAIRRGVMFAAPQRLDHDGWVDAAKKAASLVSAEEIEDAFLASLTSRRLDLRSALSSYVVATRLPAHPYRQDAPDPMCSECSLYTDEQDLNVLNFERFKWGGVRHDQVDYVAFDLEQFRRAPRIEATRQDIDAGRRLLDELRLLPPGTGAPAAAKQLRSLKGNQAERGVLLDILGVCSILQTPDHRGHIPQFVPYRARELPPHRFVDRAYPVCWWTSDHGINDSAVAKVLPRLL